MNRRYIPLNDEDSGFGIGLEPVRGPEAQYEPQRPDDIPVVGQSPYQAWSPEFSGASRFRHPQGASPNISGAHPSPSLSQASTIRRKPLIRPPTKKRTSSRTFNRLSQVLSPDFHKPAADETHPYAKYYDFRRTRDKILRTSLTQWLFTLVVAISIAGALYGYSTLTTINTNQKHVFNTLITGLSIILGMNLASSLRSYADLLRWRLLSCTWLSLHEFDLILGCSSQLKVIKLLFTSAGRHRFPFISLIQFLCLTWLLINVVAQILVAMLGLTYSLDTAQNDIFVPGTVTIVDLSSIRDTKSSLDVGGQQFTAHQYGIQGQDISLYSVADPLEASKNSVDLEALYTDLDYNSTYLRFTDYNPDDWTAYASSVRTIQSTATCVSYDITNVTYAYFAGKVLPGAMFDYTNNAGKPASLYVRDYEHGAATYIADNDLYCGTRCTHVYILQYVEIADEPNKFLNIPKSRLYDCNNTISNVTNATYQGQKYILPDKPARAIAGASAWSGYVTPLGNGSYEHLEYQLYSNDSYWSPSFQLADSGYGSAAMYISQFSVAALAAMDQAAGNGGVVAVNITDGSVPIRALSLTVEWRDTALLLGVIVALQLFTFIAVILWANKAVIKDDSYLAVAKLLAPTVMKLGEHGSVLRGEEIVDAIDGLVGHEYHVYYGMREIQDTHKETGVYRSGRESAFGDRVYRADIIERSDAVPPPGLTRVFKNGRYD